VALTQFSVGKNIHEGKVKSGQGISTSGTKIMLSAIDIHLVNHPPEILKGDWDAHHRTS
jgi:hypothetical protein